jgi:hypothetical protein
VRKLRGLPLGWGEEREYGVVMKIAFPLYAGFENLTAGETLHNKTFEGGVLHMATGYGIMRLCNSYYYSLFSWLAKLKGTNAC